MKQLLVCLLIVLPFLCGSYTAEEITEYETDFTLKEEDTDSSYFTIENDSFDIEIPETEVDFISDTLFEDMVEDLSSDDEWLNFSSMDFEEITEQEVELYPEILASGMVDSGKCGEQVFWTLDEEGVLQVTGSGTMYDYEGLYETYDVELSPFYADERIKEVYFSDGITSIGSCAFENCINLEKAIMSDTILSVNDGAFFYCPKLSDVTFSQGLTRIGMKAFNGCSQLKSIDFPDSLYSIGRVAFTGSDIHLYVRFPRNVSAIDPYNFQNNTTMLCYEDTYALTYAINNSIPYEIIYDKDSGQGGAAIRWEFDYPTHTLSFTGIGEMYDYWNYYGAGSYNPAPWAKYAKLVETLLFSEDITSIGDCAFDGFTQLTEVNIPDSVKKLGRYSFSSCSGLCTVELPSKLEIIGENAFSVCISLNEIHLPSGLLRIDEYAFSGSGLETIQFPETITWNGHSLFLGCENLKEIKIPANIKISWDFFAECSNLSRVIICEGPTSLGISCFRDCGKLESIVIPRSVSEIYGENDPYFAFSDCPNLVIYGYSGSFAQTYAKENDIPFVSLDQDTDDDGIPDDWEINGADVDNDGTIDINFPAMGADPNKPDVFVEVDWMEGLKPRANALWIVFEQYRLHGINLHIDVGPDSVDYVTGRKWGLMSGGNSIAYSGNFQIGSPDNRFKNWRDTASAFFTPKRINSFHYCLFVERYDNCDSTGASLTGTQLFLVADMEGGTSKTDISLAGTFMHELGHNLGLRHGGNDDINYKPNYLSVMNYSFQLEGLAGTGEVNYSEYELPAIDENNIDEWAGFDPFGITEGTGLKTRWYVNGKLKTSNVPISKNRFDLNNNLIRESSVRIDLNNDGIYTAMPTSINDWDYLEFKSGIIGVQYGLIDHENPFNDIPDLSVPKELTQSEAEQIAFSNHPENLVDPFEEDDKYEHKDAHLTLNITGTLPLQVKQKFKGIKIIDIAQGDSVVSWVSNKPKVVSVSKKGVLKGRKRGKATITVKTAWGATAYFKVKVQKKSVTTKKVELPVKKVTLKKGKKYSIKAILTPLTTQDKISYKSSNKRVATVSSKGVVRSKSKGKATITVKCGKKQVKLRIVVV